MTEYLIAFNDEWVPDHTAEELREKSNRAPRLAVDPAPPMTRRRSGCVRPPSGG
jgi:hypothetical protein